MAKKKLYVVSEDDRRNTIIEYTHTNIARFIREQKPGYGKRYSTLWLVELCMRTAAAELNKAFKAFIEYAEANAKDTTDLYEELGHPRYDRETEFHSVSSQEAVYLHSCCEMHIANFLTHANQMVEGVAQLSADLHRVHPQSFPYLAKRLANPDRRNLNSDICKELGKDYAAQVIAKNPTSDRKTIFHELAQISKWRNAREHDFYFFVEAQVIDGVPEMVYTNAMNFTDVPTLRFTSHDIQVCLDRFVNFLMWWCWQAEYSFNPETIRSWTPKE